MKRSPTNRRCGWPGRPLARGTGEGMEADELLCSRNARSRTPLVGRAQWKINQPPSLRENKRAWREHLYHSTRAVEDRPGHPHGEG